MNCLLCFEYLSSRLPLVSLNGKQNRNACLEHYHSPFVNISDPFNLYLLTDLPKVTSIKCLGSYCFPRIIQKVYVTAYFLSVHSLLWGIQFCNICLLLNLIKRCDYRCILYFYITDIIYAYFGQMHLTVRFIGTERYKLFRSCTPVKKQGGLPGVYWYSHHSVGFFFYSFLVLRLNPGPCTMSSKCSVTELQLSPLIRFCLI